MIQKIRIAKAIADAGVCSRRDAEKLVIEGKVLINNNIVLTPSTTVSASDVIKVNGQKLGTKPDLKVWLYHKPKGVITSFKDPDNRPTVFSLLPKSMSRVISVGRLDFNSEGLLLLTNSGEFARFLELPSNRFIRIYKVRVFGQLNLEALNKLDQGFKLMGIFYEPIKVTVISSSNSNHWLKFELTEGKNREIRKILAYLNLKISRLIRIQYGIFKLNELQPNQVQEIDKGFLQKHFRGFYS